MQKLLIKQLREAYSKLAENYTRPMKGKAGGVVVVAIDLPTESSLPQMGDI